MMTVTEKRFGEYHKDEKSVSLRNHSGTCGGGSEVLIICTTPPQSGRYRRETGEELETNMFSAIRS